MKLLIMMQVLIGLSGNVTALTPCEENTIQVYNRSLPSVVTVVVDTLGDEKSTVLSRSMALGSGFAIKPGLVITNYHVIADAARIRIVLHDGRTDLASIIGTAPEFDLALLRVPFDSEDLPPSTLGTIDDLQVGQKVLTVSSPLGLDHSVTVGIVSSLFRELPGLGIGPNLIQFDAALNPGQSGGPLIDSDGRVIGVTTAKALPAESIGFAIPIDVVKNILPDLEAMGHVFRPQLGLSGTTITPDLAVLFNLPIEHGMIIEAVEEGSVAARAGLRAGIHHVFLGGHDFVLGGDILVGLDGVPLRASGDLLLRLLASKPGDLLRFTVRNGGSERTVVLKVPAMAH